MEILKIEKFQHLDKSLRFRQNCDLDVKEEPWFTAYSNKLRGIMKNKDIDNLHQLGTGKAPSPD